MADDAQKQPVGGISIRFVGDAIGAAIRELKEKQRSLPPDAKNVHRAVDEAIEGLKKVSEHTESLCRTWFMAPK